MTTYIIISAGLWSEGCDSEECRGISMHTSQIWMQIRAWRLFFATVQNVKYSEEKNWFCGKMTKLILISCMFKNQEAFSGQLCAKWSCVCAHNWTSTSIMRTQILGSIWNQELNGHYMTQDYMLKCSSLKRSHIQQTAAIVASSWDKQLASLKLQSVSP